jgi:hypothetical protein
MVTLGVDAHKRTHTIVAVDEHGAKVAERTIGTTTKHHLGLLRRAAQLGVDRSCRGRHGGRGGRHGQPAAAAADPDPRRARVPPRGHHRRQDPPQDPIRNSPQDSAR